MLHFLISIFIIYVFSIGVDIVRRCFVSIFNYIFRKWIKNDKINNLENKICKLLILDFITK